MNNIYIINNNFDIIVELNFTNNTINKNNILYKFEIIDNNKRTPNRQLYNTWQL